MELTRRDAAAALVAIGATGGAALGANRIREQAGTPARADDDLPDDERVRETLRAVAHVVYPSAVSGVDDFVDGFLDGRLVPSAHATGLREAVADLEGLATAWFDGRPAELSPANRDRLLREVGADVADEDPDGTTAERVRYYVVNELLLALYASPTGGELVGLENPQGHPGGTDSYTRGPDSDTGAPR